MKRAWIPVVMVLVLVIAGFAVWRIRGIFGSHQLPTYAGSMTDDKNNSKPKH
ncbi:MmpS family transport accessory protein, partial [Mycobacteroides abscessus]